MSKESGNEKQSPPTLKFSGLFKSFILQQPVSISTLPSSHFWLPGTFAISSGLCSCWHPLLQGAQGPCRWDPSQGASSAPCQTLSQPLGQEEGAAEAGAPPSVARAGAPQHTCRMMDIFLNLESVNRLLFLN